MVYHQFLEDSDCYFEECFLCRQTLRLTETMLPYVTLKSQSAYHEVSLSKLVWEFQGHVFPLSMVKDSVELVSGRLAARTTEAGRC